MQHTWLRLVTVPAVSMLVACGSTSAGAPDAGSSADLVQDLARDTPEISTDLPPPGCDPGMPPLTTLPEVASRVVVLGEADAGRSFPTPSGGDPSGRWVFEDATLYLPAAARGQVLTAMSRVVGTGFAVFEEGQRVRVGADLRARVETVMVGPVTTPIQFQVRGSYTLSNGRFAIVPECFSGATPMMGMGNAELGFSRDSPDRARLYLDANGVAGRVVVEIQMRRVDAT